MNSQIARNNHYVPQWYQRGFLQKGLSTLHVLDMAPKVPTQASGLAAAVRPRSMPPSRAFCERDLYTTQFGEVLNDDIEKYLFGSIDKRGAEAVRALLANDPARLHSHFGALFDYLDTQKLRTPKGLDWILSRYRDLSRIDLLIEMQRLRDMHCKMWTEGCREIVSAAESSVKFLVSDHPVTTYHREFPAQANSVNYPAEPGIELIGTQTVFVLDRDNCLILTNLEYADAPGTVDVMSQRTNARFRGRSIVRTDAFIRGRNLSAEEVVSINHLLKSRARRYVAAGSADWLTPEVENARNWREIGDVLLPRNELWRFGGEIYVGFEDGTSQYQDAFGRTSRAHEYLSKPSPTSNPADDEYCPCGNGHAFGYCCKMANPHDRPSWTSYSVRERNLMLCAAVKGILGLSEGKTWDDVRRELSDGQVKDIHEAFESLWPQDTLLREILPPPREGVLRALFMGHLDPRTLPLVATSWLDYFDELVLPSPFVNAATIKPEYSPTASPSSYKDQTLRNVLTLLELERHIFEGRVHLVPDPSDLDPQLRREILSFGESRSSGVVFSEHDKRLMEELGKDDLRRWRLRGSDEQLATIVLSAVPGISPEMIKKAVEQLKMEREDDPLSLLQPILPGEEGAQLLAVKSFTLEMGLYLASLTGSIVYCQMDAMWNILHEPDGVRHVVTTDEWSANADFLEGVKIRLRISDDALGSEALERIASVRDVLAQFLLSALKDSPADLFKLSEGLSSLRDELQSDTASHKAGHISAHIKASVPVGGFYRKDVNRLLLTYGLASKALPVPMALKLQLAPVE